MDKPYLDQGIWLHGCVVFLGELVGEESEYSAHRSQIKVNLQADQNCCMV
jgi:hypothetical protein